MCLVIFKDDIKDPPYPYKIHTLKADQSYSQVDREVQLLYIGQLVKGPLLGRREPGALHVKMSYCTCCWKRKYGINTHIPTDRTVVGTPPCFNLLSSLRKLSSQSRKDLVLVLPFWRFGKGVHLFAGIICAALVACKSSGCSPLPSWTITKNMTDPSHIIEVWVENRDKKSCKVDTKKNVSRNPMFHSQWSLILPTQTSCTILREITRNYHTFCCLFDPTKKVPFNDPWLNHSLQKKAPCATATRKMKRSDFFNLGSQQSALSSFENLWTQSSRQSSHLCVENLVSFWMSCLCIVFSYVLHVVILDTLILQ